MSDTSSVITREKAIDVPHQLGKIRDVLLEILLCGLDPRFSAESEKKLCPKLAIPAELDVP